MDPEASRTNNVLERMLLDENAEPVNLTLSLLEDITNHFSIDCKIGSGGFAVVYKGTVGKLRVAVKKLTKTHELPESKFHKEVECLMKAKHRNIVRFLGYCAETQGRVQDCEGRFIMADMRNWLLCFEYVPNGSLENYITDPSSGLEWLERFGIIRGICHGLQYLHKNRILHLDLKPANILLDDRMEAKISDFGLSRCLDVEQSRVTTIHLSGTLGYLAPEFFSGKVSFASDIYSLGIVIVEILTGAKNFPEVEEVTQSWMNRLEGDTQLEQVRVCTKIGIECMESDPKKRPVACHIIDMLDKTTGADETCSSSSLVELQVTLLKGQSDEESIRELARSFKLEDIKEGPEETVDAAERPENGHSWEGEENTDRWLSWDAQDTEWKGGSKPSVLDKLNIFKIFKRGTHKKEGKKDESLSENKKDGRPVLNGPRIFTREEIIKITRNYSTLIGTGAFCNIYKGSLRKYTREEFQNVAVKTSILDDAYTSKRFLNTMEIQTHMKNHMNIIKLIGCCLEVGCRMLVEEYAANGSLQEMLHGNKNKLIPLDLRLDIAIGSAEGLRYMHSTGIRHGDVRPENILLDENITPKIADFELSQIINLNVDEPFTHIVVGHKFYTDPVFLETGLLTLKSDVYSFGIVLLELITGRKSDSREEPSLAAKYCKCYEIEKTGGAMFDKEIAAAEDISVLEEIGQLAIRCVKEDVEERPDMTEVTERLVMIRRGRRLGKARNAS